MPDFMQILENAGGGDPAATEQLAELLHAERRSLARREMAAERPDHTLEPTALVHEAYLRLVGGGASFENRAHFYGAAARAIRRVLVEHARARSRLERGNAGRRLELSAIDPVAPERDADLLALDEALARLAELDPGKARLVELRFIAGMTLEEAARALGVSASTVVRDWRTARARPLRPQHASPEQLQGLRLTTATDVYSLGVVLYELLTGRRPWRKTGRSPAEWERIVTHELPARPSTALQPRAKDQSATAAAFAARLHSRPARLQRRLRGDLDRIVLMPLRKEPERRYASAEQIAEDLERYLAGLPMRASRDTLGYRAQRFVQRNRLAVGAAAIVLVAQRARPLAEEALAIRERLLDPEHFHALQTRISLSEVGWQLERLDASEGHLRAAVEGYRALGEAVREGLEGALASFSALQIRRGDLEAAARSATEALESIRERRGADQPRAAVAHAHLASIHARRRAGARVSRPAPASTAGAEDPARWGRRLRRGRDAGRPGR